MQFNKAKMKSGQTKQELKKWCSVPPTTHFAAITQRSIIKEGLQQKPLHCRTLPRLPNKVRGITCSEQHFPQYCFCWREADPAGSAGRPAQRDKQTNEMHFYTQLWKQVQINAALHWHKCFFIYHRSYVWKMSHNKWNLWSIHLHIL